MNSSHAMAGRLLASLRSGLRGGRAALGLPSSQPGHLVTCSGHVFKMLCHVPCVVTCSNAVSCSTRCHVPAVLGMSVRSSSHVTVVGWFFRFCRAVRCSLPRFLSLVLPPSHPPPSLTHSLSPTLPPLFPTQHLSISLPPALLLALPPTPPPPLSHTHIHTPFFNFFPSHIITPNAHRYPA